MAVLLRREAGIVFSVAPPSVVPGTAKYGGTSREYRETAIICREITAGKIPTNILKKGAFLRGFFKFLAARTEVQTNNVFAPMLLDFARGCC